MPSRPQAEPTPRPLHQEPGLVAPQRPPQSVSPSKLVTGRKPVFVLMVHPGEWICDGGLILPRLMKVEAKPGVANNGPNDRLDPTGAVTVLERQGWMRVPTDLEWEHNGVKRTGLSHPDGTWRDWYASDSPSGVWSEAWVRPRITGGRVRWMGDLEAKRAFQAAVKAWLLQGQELDRDLVQTAITPSLDIARGYLPRITTNPIILGRYREVLAQVPAELVPADLKAHLE